jgi:hypothetical protein
LRERFLLLLTNLGLPTLAPHDGAMPSRVALVSVVEALITRDMSPCADTTPVEHVRPDRSVRLWTELENPLATVGEHTIIANGLNERDRRRRSFVIKFYQDRPFIPQGPTQGARILLASNVTDFSLPTWQ